MLFKMKDYSKRIEKIVVQYEDGSTEEIVDSYALNNMDVQNRNVTIGEIEEINEMFNEEDFMEDILVNHGLPHPYFSTMYEKIHSTTNTI